jgi:hypothetical protein
VNFQSFLLIESAYVLTRLSDENGATSTLPARTFLVTGEKKYLIKIVLSDGEWCRECTACQTFGDVRRALKEAAVILNQRFWFTINKVFFRDRFLLAWPFFAKPDGAITVQSSIIVCRLMIPKCRDTLRVRYDRENQLSDLVQTLRARLSLPEKVYIRNNRKGLFPTTPPHMIKEFSQFPLELMNRDVMFALVFLEIERGVRTDPKQFPLTTLVSDVIKVMWDVRPGTYEFYATPADLVLHESLTSSKISLVE